MHELWIVGSVYREPAQPFLWEPKYEFLIMPIRKTFRNKKQKYIPDDKYQWNESFKYETRKTKYLPWWNIILTNQSDAIFWVAAIAMVSKIRKHITVGFHLVMNKEIVWIKMNKKTRKVCKTENGNGSYRIVSFH